MSLANIQGKLSRAEMKNIMAGSGSGSGSCWFNSDCRWMGDSHSCCWCGTPYPDGNLYNCQGMPGYCAACN